MKTIEYTNPNIDRSEWTDGLDEPDKIQWEDKETGLPCLAVRNPLFHHWCGYVGVTKEHPYFEKDYQEIRDIEVHGGLTFADTCDDESQECSGICHVDENEEKVWWLGFDCAHHCDSSPNASIGWCRSGFYRSLGYIKDNCAHLAQQLKERENELSKDC